MIANIGRSTSRALVSRTASGAPSSSPVILCTSTDSVAARSAHPMGLNSTAHLTTKHNSLRTAATSSGLESDHKGNSNKANRRASAAKLSHPLLTKLQTLRAFVKTKNGSVDVTLRSKPNVGEIIEPAADATYKRYDSNTYYNPGSIHVESEKMKFGNSAGYRYPRLFGNDPKPGEETLFLIREHHFVSNKTEAAKSFDNHDGHSLRFIGDSKTIADTIARISHVHGDVRVYEPTLHDNCKSSKSFNFKPEPDLKEFNKVVNSAHSPAGE